MFEGMDQGNKYLMKILIVSWGKPGTDISSRNRQEQINPPQTIHFSLVKWGSFEIFKYFIEVKCSEEIIKAQGSLSV